MTDEQKATDEHKGIAGRITGSGAVLIGLPVAAGVIATSFGMPVDDVLKVATGLGVVPAVLIVVVMWAGGYVKEQGGESRRREDRMATRLDKIEDRYHNELVGLASRSIDAVTKNTEAFRDLHNTVVDHHKQTVLLLTRNIPGGSASIMGPAESISESTVGRFVDLHVDKPKVER